MPETPAAPEHQNGPRACYFLDNPVPMAELRVSELEDYFTLSVAEVIHALQRELFVPNMAMCQLFGAADSQQLRTHLFPLPPDENAEKWFKLISDVAESTSQSAVTDFATTRLDGGVLRIGLEARMSNATPATALVIATERTVVAELREQLNLLSLLPETNPNMVFVLEGSDHVVYSNPTARRWLNLEGLDASTGVRELLGEFPAEDGESTKHIVRGDQRYQIQVVSISGTSRSMVTVADVTEEHRVRSERNIFEHAFETTSNPMVITDHEGRIEYINHAFTEFYGYTPEEAAGRDTRMLNPGKEVYRDMGIDTEAYDQLFSTMWQDLLETGHHETEMVNQCAEGHLGRIRSIMSKISVAEDAPPKYLAVHVDMDEIYQREEQARIEILETIARVGELRDNETGQHMHRVGLYARRLAEQLGMSSKYCDDIQAYAPLHDIGKVGISDEILLAPRKLTAQEFSAIEQHTVLGHGILSQASTLEMAADIALSHHEKFDGTGYPHGAAGDSIPLSARIVALSDVYDALRSRRPYKEPWNHASASEEIRRIRGAHFCPDVVTAFDRIEADFREISHEYADG
ncbi:MAG: HD domain-containing phosphohydrolase [Alkalispirochaeta sp.]